MDQLPPWWRSIEDAPRSAPTAQPDRGPGIDRRLAVALGGLAAVVVGAGIVLITAATPTPRVVLSDASESPEPSAAASSGASGTWLIDVEGGVAQPGLYRMPPGSRVGDAIRAAGGFGPRVDAAAASAELNLAALLEDGAKVEVPVRGARHAVAASGAPKGAKQRGAGEADRVDLNRADAAGLEALPGIGPVTAAKILASREEAAFQAVDELRTRKLVGPSTFEKIKDLVRVGG